jgi:hypothetical protein
MIMQTKNLLTHLLNATIIFFAVFCLVYFAQAIFYTTLDIKDMSAISRLNICIWPIYSVAYYAILSIRNR